MTFQFIWFASLNPLVTSDELLKTRFFFLNYYSICDFVFTKSIFLTGDES